MAIRQFTILALVFFAIVGMACAASDAPTPSASHKAPAASEGEEAGGGIGGGSAKGPAAADGGSSGASPSEGPGASDASIFKVSMVGAFVQAVTATLFFF